MFATRVFIGFLACACIASGPIWAGTANVAPSAGKSSGQVSFSSYAHQFIHEGGISGVFTIECKPRAGVDLRDASWMVECNKLGRAAIDKAVSGGLIEPVTGVPFVKASELPASPYIQGMAISRNFPLAGKPSHHASHRGGHSRKVPMNSSTAHVKGR